MFGNLHRGFELGLCCGKLIALGRVRLEAYASVEDAAVLGCHRIRPNPDAKTRAEGRSKSV